MRTVLPPVLQIPLSVSLEKEKFSCENFLFRSRLAYFYIYKYVFPFHSFTELFGFPCSTNDIVILVTLSREDYSSSIKNLRLVKKAGCHVDRRFRLFFDREIGASRSVH